MPPFVTRYPGTPSSNRDEQLQDLSDKLLAARNSAHQQGADWAEKQQRINDCAYFILAWGQFEARIDNISKAAIRRRLDSPDWEQRRAWDSYDPVRPRARFEDRLALVLDRSNATSDAYRRTMRFYEQRNRIAHGSSLMTGIDVQFMIAELYQIESELRA